ncbi:MAG: hypothetical protein ACI8ZM_003032 [Crocinitomix sp.]|jgi:hypothetical protein
MKKILLMSVVALLLVACNKNQKVVKQLDGNWNATSYVFIWDGVTTDILANDGYSLTWGFDNCKLKDDEFCSTTWTETSDGTSYIQMLEYRVAGYGTSLELRDVEYPSELIYLKITEQTRETLSIEIDEGDGNITKITFEKQ